MKVGRHPPSSSALGAIVHARICAAPVARSDSLRDGIALAAGIVLKPA